MPQTTVRHVGVLGTFLPPAEPVPLVISDFVRSAVARHSPPFLNRGRFESGVAPVPLVISDFGACFCCCLSGSRARVRTCSFFVTFSLFAVAACCAENARARAHVLLFWHFVQLSLCAVSLMKSRARACARAAFWAPLPRSLFIAVSTGCVVIERAHAHTQAFWHLVWFTVCTWAVLGHSWALLGSSGPHLGFSWALLGLSWALLGSSGPLLGSPGLPHEA